MTEREMNIYDVMVGLGIATTEELDLVRMVSSGTWEEILTVVLYIRTGYRTLEQLLEEMEGGC